jgi:hypothetical protein
MPYSFANSKARSIDLDPTAAISAASLHFTDWANLWAMRPGPSMPHLIIFFICFLP